VYNNYCDTVLSSLSLSYFHRGLGELLKEFMTSVVADMERQLSPSEFQNEPLVQKCSVLQDKLNGLLANLKEEIKSGSKFFPMDSTIEPPAHIDGSGSEDVTNGGKNGSNGAVKAFKQREALMSRANSLKKAMQGVLDATEKVLDMQAEEMKEFSEGRGGEEGNGRRVRGGNSGSGGGIDGRHGGGNSPTDESGSGGERQMMSLRLPKDSISSVVDLAPYVLIWLQCCTCSYVHQLLLLYRLLPDMKELSCMNNYFGIGLGAKIAYQFSNSRTK
jgi:hypothetical protein